MAIIRNGTLSPTRLNRRVKGTTGCCLAEHSRVYRLLTGDDLDAGPYLDAEST